MKKKLDLEKTCVLGATLHLNPPVCSISFIDRYDSTTGSFTVPPGGTGLYYFSTYLGVSVSEYGRFDMVLNDETVCTAEGDSSNVSGDRSQGLCSMVLDIAEGN